MDMRILREMISAQQFRFFLRHGHLESLEPGAPMSILLETYGQGNWYTQPQMDNGLIYGIIKVGIVEFHIYYERLNGISYRPDLPFRELDYEGVEMPWIYRCRKLDEVKAELDADGIGYKEVIVEGPRSDFFLGGSAIILNAGNHVFLETESGVAFLFEESQKGDRLVAYQVCKYYGLHEK